MTPKKKSPWNRSARKSQQRPAVGRELALLVLSDLSDGDRFISELLDEHLAGRDPARARRPLAMEIASGVVRRQTTLDALLAAHVSRPRDEIERELYLLLQIGVYQLVFTNIAPHAAVNETVELARWYGRPDWSGFLNGVFRAVQRHLTVDHVEHPGISAIPIANGQYRTMSIPVFPDPNENPADWYATAFSLPNWLAERWIARLPLSDAIALGFWCNATPTMSLRINTLRSTRDAVLTALLEAGIDAVAGTDSCLIQLARSVTIDRLPGFAEGHFTIQDASAVTAAQLVNPTPGETILDLCAAPGGKTMHLAELMHNTGRIVATDVNPHRLNRVAENAFRLGIDIVEARPISRDGSDIPIGPFDAVLVDAPCSNTGVLAKRPEARWRANPENIAELAELQRMLLATACRLVDPGGRVVYSTCSIEPDENRNVVDAVLATHPDFTVTEIIEHHPGRPADGGWQARLARQ